MKKVDTNDQLNMYKVIHEVAEEAVKHPRVQELLLDTREEFDVAIIEWLFTEMYVGVPAVFNCPFIWSSSIEPHPMVLRLIDDIPNPAYVPDHMSPLSPPLNFFERAAELWNVLKLYYIRWSMSDIETKAYNEAYGPAFAKRGRQIPALHEIKFNASLMLGNSHVSTGQALQLPQNYIPIAGYHIKKDTPPLPENLKKLMDDASHGVIYFSLGTMMKGNTLPQELKTGFLKTFSGLKQTVIWKFEEPLPNLPENVYVIPWTPQQSILAHPNIVLFITHGGLLSTTETIHYGVPIIGIPLFADQFINIKRAVAKGFAKHVRLSYNAPVELKTAIEEVLGDSKYREKVKELSVVYHDRPILPEQEMIHWVEHVAKTRDSRHLRSIALMVPWYQKMYLDLLTLFFFIVYVFVQLVKRVLGTCKRLKKKRD